MVRASAASPGGGASSSARCSTSGNAPTCAWARVRSASPSKRCGPRGSCYHRDRHSPRATATRGRSKPGHGVGTVADWWAETGRSGNPTHRQPVTSNWKLSDGRFSGTPKRAPATGIVSAHREVLSEGGFRSTSSRAVWFGPASHGELGCTPLWGAPQSSQPHDSADFQEHRKDKGALATERPFSDPARSTATCPGPDTNGSDSPS
jgi:hypothetical protein